MSLAAVRDARQAFKPKEEHPSPPEQWATQLTAALIPNGRTGAHLMDVNYPGILSG